jgi:hypothetical protein
VADAGSTAPPDAQAADSAPPADLPPATCKKRRCKVHLACGKSGDGCGGTLDCGACSATLNTLEVAAQHLVYDGTRDRLYATVTGADPDFPNRLLTIDPTKMEVVDSLPVGSDPRVLALSSDASTLWVGLDGAAAMRRVDLTVSPPAVGPLVSLPASVRSMVVLPGTPRAVAVALGGYLNQAAIFDDGVMRAMASMPFDDITLLAAGPGNLLFGFNGASTGYEFFVLTVGPAGLTYKPFSNLVMGYQSTLVYADGRVYASSGQVVNVSNPDAPVAAGTFHYFGPMIPRGNNRLTMLSPGDSFSRTGPTLRALESANFTQVASAPVDVMSEGVTDLTLVKPDTIIWIGTGDFQTPLRVHFLRHDLIRN